MAQHVKYQSKKAQHSAYKTSSRYAANKRRKLARHIKDQPNDECAKKALNNIALYRRKAPKTSAWSKSEIAITSLFRAAGDKKDYRELRLSQIEEVNKHKNELSDKARQALEAQANKPKREVKTDLFQLGKRVTL